MINNNDYTLPETKKAPGQGAACGDTARLEEHGKDSENHAIGQVSEPENHDEFSSSPGIHELPIDGLHDTVQRYIFSVQRAYQCPREYVIVPVFSCASSAVGNKAYIRGKYNNSLSLWFLLVGPSGTNKSQPVKCVLAPLLAINKRFNEEWRQAKKLALQNGEEPPKAPKRAIIDDATREARAVKLADNPNGVLLYRDEAAGIFKDIFRYTRSSGAVQEMLSIFDNAQLIIDRKTSESIFIERPFMNLLGGIQNDLLADTFSEYYPTGLPQRILFAFPEKVENPPYSDVQVNEEQSRQWDNIVTSLWDATPMELVTPDARDIYADYFNQMQQRKTDAASDNERSIYSKLQIHVIRLAGVVTMLNDAAAGEYSGWISADTMRYAVRCMDYFEWCALRVMQQQPTISANIKNIKGPDFLREFNRRWPIKNQSAFAAACGLNQSYISDCINRKR